MDKPATWFAALAATLFAVITGAFMFPPAGAQVATGSHPVTLSALTNTVVALVPNNTRGAALMQLYCFNASNATAWVELFDTANTAAVTLATTVPVWAAAMQGNTNAMMSFMLPIGGIQFGQGIQAAAVTAFNGNAAPSANLSCAAAYY
jgi:hypothetical protein